ncbi:hypothetical protein ACFXAF_25855 [Kitasatospora sp. NPDC059463]|uniref:hypothetical protein n=1 Tax=unclassified Kitasatospora TaxID=2633591 RepID=UPI0036B6B297
MTGTTMTYDRAVEILRGVRSDGAGSPPLERLAAIYTGDLDAVVPRALTWSQRTRRTARRLLATVLPVLRELVAEIVDLDRRVQAADTRIEALEARPLPLAADADDHARLAAALDVAQRLTARLQPAPRSVTVETVPHAPGPTILVHALDNGPAVEAWAALLGASIERKKSGGGYVYLTATCTLDGIPVSCQTIILPSFTAVTA